MKKLRHTVVASIAFVGVTVTLAACSSGGGPLPDGDGTPSGAVNIILNSNPTGNAVAALVDEYNALGGPQVKTQLFAEQQMRDKIQLNLQSRSSDMDLYMSLPNREGPLYFTSGYYEQLDEYVEDAPADYDAAGFASAALQAMKVDDKLVALPLNVEGPVMYYRTDLFDQWGLEVPTTIDELIDTAAQIKEKSAGSIVPITLRGAADALPYTFGPFFHAEGLQWTDDDNEPNFDDSKAVTAIKQYTDLAASYGPPGVANYSFNESTNLFASGGAAIELESTNLFSTIMDPNTSIVTETTSVANIPGGADGPMPTISAWGLAMSPFSINKSAAWDFMQWITSPEQQAKMALAGNAPSRASVFDDADYQAALDSDAEQQWADAVLFIQENGNTEVGPVGTQAPAMRKVIGDGVGSAILGSATPEEAAQAIQAGLKPLLQQDR
ncbi:sugar ABC transporter substrate-binding protein [Okibacterium endophyticum]